MIVSTDIGYIAMIVSTNIGYVAMVVRGKDESTICCKRLPKCFRKHITQIRVYIIPF